MKSDHSPGKPGGARPSEWDVDALWTRQFDRIVAARRTVRPWPSRWKVLVPLMAASTAALCMGTMSSGRLGTSIQSYAAAPGQRRTVTLSDGTQLTLAPASSLRVPQDYAMGHRSVTLLGEAYFTVVHDAAHPFVVHVGHTTITDVGTAFDVRHYGDDDVVRVAVTKGSVAIAHGDQDLLAGDLALVNGDQVSVIHDADVMSATAWTAGALMFRDTPLPEALATIGRWYDLDIRVTGSQLRRLPFTATFVAADPLPTVLDVIGRSVNAHVVRSGRHVVMTPASPAQPAGLS